MEWGATENLLESQERAQLTFDHVFTWKWFASNSLFDF